MIFGRRVLRVVTAVAAVAAASPTSARADVTFGGAHVVASGGLAYLAGAPALQGRAGLEAGALATTAPPAGTQGDAGNPGQSSGFLFGGAATLGFERLRATGILEAGWGSAKGYAGYALLFGPELQYVRATGLGATGRFIIWVWASEIGIRIGGLAVGAQEVNASLLLGFGIN